MTGITRIAVNRPVTTLMCSLALIFLGYISYKELAVQLLPDISFPGLSFRVQMSSGEWSPEETNERLTAPVEKMVASLAGVNEMQTWTWSGGVAGYTMFSRGTDMRFRIIELQDKLNKWERTQEEEMWISIDRWSTGDVAQELAELILEVPIEQRDMTSMVADTVVRRLRSIEGVSRVEVSGELTPNILLETEQDQLQSQGISVNQLIEAINRRARETWWLGEIRETAARHPVKMNYPVESLDEILKIEVGSTGVHTVGSLTEAGRVVREENSIFRRNGRQAVRIGVEKERDRNTIEMAKLLRARVEELNTELPAGFNLRIREDLAEPLEKLISSLAKLATMGAFLSMVVLMFFLRNIRMAMVVTVAIPAAVMITFNAMYAAGLSINVMSLMGLLIGVGMLVDGAIVVVENVFRHARHEPDHRTAAWMGAKEVNRALIISTATNLVVFAPLFFVDGQLALVMKEPALSLAFPMLISLCVAMTLIPMLAARVISKAPPMAAGGHIEPGPLARFNPWQRRHKRSRRLLQELVFMGAKAGLRHPVRLALVTFFMLLLTLGASSLKVAVQQAAGNRETRSVELHGRPPLGSTLEEADQFFRVKEAEVRARMEEDKILEGFNARIERDGGRIQLYIADEYRDYEPTEYHRYFKDLESGDDQTGFRFRPFEQAALMSQRGVSNFTNNNYAQERVILTGENMGALLVGAVQVQQFLKQKQDQKREVTDVFFDEQQGNLELVYDPDVELFQVMQADYRALGQFFRARNEEGVSTSLILREDIVDRRVTVKIRPPQDGGEEPVKSTLSELRQTRVPLAGGGWVDLDRLGDFSVNRTTPFIQKRDRQRNLPVQFNLGTVYSRPGMAKARESLLKEYQKEISALELPPGVSAALEGTLSEARDQQITFHRLVLLAILMIYGVMAFFFESLLSPLVIMLTLPLAWIGSVWGVIFFNTSLTETAMLGVILLIGLVVNNGILLVEYTQQMRRNRGYSRPRAVMAAISFRLRPILMTTMTSILGLLPMVFSEQAKREATPIVAVVIGGLVSSALLTLFVVPVVYNTMGVLADRAGARLAGVRGLLMLGFQRLRGRGGDVAGGASESSPGLPVQTSAAAGAGPLSARMELGTGAGAREISKAEAGELGISIQGVTKIYPQFRAGKLLHVLPSRSYNWGRRPPRGRQALHDVSLEIGPGMFGLLGPNGAGKSSLMKILTGLVPPTYGAVYVAGMKVADHRERIRPLIGYLPQDFGVYGSISLTRYLEYFAPLVGLDDPTARMRRIGEVIELVGLETSADIALKNLSGGMRQRAGIAQMLLKPCPILIVDEPTAGLDPVERVRFRLLLSELARNRVIILSTHIVEDITSSCRAVGILNRGKLIFKGGIEQVRADAEGLVWDLQLPVDAPNPISRSHLLYRKSLEDGRIRYRHISDHALPGAVAVRPSFEDAYVALLLRHDVRESERTGQPGPGPGREPSETGAGQGPGWTPEPSPSMP